MAQFSDLSNKVRYVGFCGADDSVVAEVLPVISAQYPFIEWGVLFRTDLEGTPRYASPAWVEHLSALHKAHGNKMHLAAHFCFNRCQEVLDGNSTFAAYVHSLGFGRIQINATAANGVVVDDANLSQVVANIRKVMTDVPTVEFIFQLNDETKPIWNLLSVNPPANVSILHDASCGKGVGIAEFPSPSHSNGVPLGYAGGIGPATIASVLQAVGEVVPGDKSVKPVWIDMESSLRTLVAVNKDGSKLEDVFDINKCMQCAVLARNFGL